jgi:hypothetical protein
MYRDSLVKVMQVAVAGGAVLSALTLYAFSAYYGNLNQDEGWYLYAARCVTAGSHPYRDFFFTQAPLMPWFYSWFEALWGSFGVLGGRVFTAVIALLSALCAGAMASRAVPRERSLQAATVAFALIACNLYHVYFTTIPKTYALASLFLCGGFLTLTFCFFRKRRSHSRMSRMWALPAGFLIAMAIGTRLSLIVVLPVTVLLLLLNFRKSGSAFFWFALGGAIGIFLLFAPVYLNNWEQFIFSQTFHIQREGSGIDPFLTAGSLSRLVRAYLTHCMVFCALILAFLLYGRGKKPAFCGSQDGDAYHGDIWPLIWFVAFVAVFAVHIATPHPYDDYQVPIMGLLAAALAAWVVNRLNDRKIRMFFVIGAVIAVNLCSFSSSLIQQWFTEGQDRFWILRKQLPDIRELQIAAREIRTLAGDDDTLLTQDTYLAVEAGMRVPRGLEMGPFGYFPELSDKQAARYHVLNRRLLSDLIERAPCSVAAFSGYGLSIQAPVMDRVPQAEYQRLMALLGNNYDFVGEVENFGQNSTLLQILKKREKLAD